MSYHRTDGASEARLLQAAVAAELGQPVYLDAAKDADARSTLKALARSEALLVLLSARCLEAPSVLLEVYLAVRLRLPVVCVHLTGGGYEYTTSQSAWFTSW